MHDHLHPHKIDSFSIIVAIWINFNYEDLWIASTYATYTDFISIVVSFAT